MELLSRNLGADTLVGWRPYLALAVISRFTAAVKYVLERVRHQPLHKII